MLHQEDFFFRSDVGDGDAGVSLGNRQHLCFVGGILINWNKAARPEIGW